MPAGRAGAGCRRVAVGRVSAVVCGQKQSVMGLLLLETAIAGHVQAAYNVGVALVCAGASGAQSVCGREPCVQLLASCSLIRGAR